MAEFSQTVRHELKENLQNKNLRAVVLTGSGRAFSAGGDIDWLIDRHNKSQVSTFLKFKNVQKNLYNLHKYTIYMYFSGPACWK